MNSKVKRIIAKESLIILGLGCILYILGHFFLQNVPVVLPKYRLEFAGGESYAISIFPYIRNDSNYNKFLEDSYNPSPKVIERRIKEFIKTGNIKSSLIGSKHINPGQIYISRLYSRLVNTPFILKIAFIYLFFTLLRCIIWAVRILIKPSLQP